MGQNRNKFVSSALLCAVTGSNYLKIIDQKFLESELRKWNVTPCIPRSNLQSARPMFIFPANGTVIHMARRHNPYVVVPIRHWDFIDFKEVQNENFKNTERDINDDKVRWRDIVHLQYRKESPDHIFYKYVLEDQDFKSIKVKQPKRGKPSSMSLQNLPRKYKSRLSISTAKKEDLLSLCRSGVIPADCSSFYEALPVNKSTKNRLAEPDMEEDDFTD
jgi:hypothetical protein